MAFGVSASTIAPFAPEGLLLDLLTVSLTGVNVLSPVYSATGQLVDFALDYLNPAAQRMAGLGERPGGTLSARFPNTATNGTFEFYRRVFQTGEGGRHDFNYQADGLDNYFHVAARRSGELLLVSFTDTSDHSRTPVEKALRESQAAERHARAEAEQQRQRFQEVLMQLPAHVAVYQGPDHVYQFVNPPYQSLFPHRTFLGRPFREGTPESVALGVVALFDRVYQTGEPYRAYEMEGSFDFAGTGELEQVFLNLYLHPLRNAQGDIAGVLDFSYDVTEQVRARQQVQQLNEELEARVQQRTQQLYGQQHLLQQIMAQVPAAIVALEGPEHRFAFANSLYSQLVGGRIQVGKTVAEMLPEMVEQGFVQMLDQVYHTGQLMEGKEVALLVKPLDGVAAHHYFDFTYQPRPDEQGQTQGLLVFAVDVTERVRSRQQTDALQAQLLATAHDQAAERLAFFHIFEQAPVLVALLRAPNHTFEYVNPAYQALFAGRQLVGRTVADAVPEMVEHGFVMMMDRTYQTGETYVGQELPFTALPAPGQLPHPGYYNFTYQAYRENGQIAGVSIFAYDVTEQVLARQQREGQRQQLVETFAQAPVAICVFRGPAYVLELVNPPMGVMLGHSPAELLGRPFFEALPELTSQGLREVLDGVRQTGQPFVTHERAIHLAHRPEQVGYYNFTYEPLRDDQGQVAAITCVAIEVTQQVKARQHVQELNAQLASINQQLQGRNEELNESNRQLVRTNVDLDTFVYTASHDLKAPITNIESILLALRDTLPPAVQQDELVNHLLGLLDTTVSRFQFTIGQLTDISRLQLAHSGPKEKIALAPVVAAVRLDLAPAIVAADTQLAVEVAPELVVSFSPANLRSIVYNLLSNAIKYRAPDRPARVWMRAEQTPTAVVLTVQDNGLGMSEVQQRQLFGLFQRLHTHVEGTGVGLYISKRLIENAGGTITVHSQPEVGTTFTVVFPR